MTRFWLCWFLASLPLVGGSMDAAFKRSPPDDLPYLVTGIAAGVMLLVVGVMALREGKPKPLTEDAK